jgi:hypothetical protein
MMSRFAKGNEDDDDEGIIESHHEMKNAVDSLDTDCDEEYVN